MIYITSLKQVSVTKTLVRSVNSMVYMHKKNMVIGSTVPVVSIIQPNGTQLYRLSQLTLRVSYINPLFFNQLHMYKGNHRLRIPTCCVTPLYATMRLSEVAKRCHNHALIDIYNAIRYTYDIVFYRNVTTNTM